MNNHIEVNHSNGVTIHYTEGPVYDPADADWERHRRKVAVGFVGVIMLATIILDGRLVGYLLAAAAILGTGWLCVKVMMAVYAADQRYRAQVAELAGRADAQHAALMRGNTFAGMYGAYPPAPLGLNLHANIDQ